MHWLYANGQYPAEPILRIGKLQTPIGYEGIKSYSSISHILSGKDNPPQTHITTNSLMET